MSDTNLETINRIVIPPKWEQAESVKKQELLETLQSITDDQIDAMWDEIDLIVVKKMLDNIKNNSKKLDFKDVEILIKSWHFGLIMKKIKRFKNADHKAILLSIINYLSTLDDNFKKSDFVLSDDTKWLDKDVALAILNSKSQKLLDIFFNNIDKFSSLDDEVAQAFINAGYEDKVFKKFDKFNITKKDIILLAIEKWLAPGFRNVEWLDEDFVDKVIKLKAFTLLIFNLKYFQQISHKKIILKIINAGWGDELLSHFSLYWASGLDKDIITALLDNNCALDKLLEVLWCFSWLDSEIAIRLIVTDDKQQYWYISWIAESLLPLGENVFKDLNCDVALILINKWYTHYVARGLWHFNDLTDDIAKKLIDAWYAKNVKDNINSFTWLSFWTKVRLFWK